jgi:flagella basal body P-ring formation protein FlgA
MRCSGLWQALKLSLLLLVFLLIPALSRGAEVILKGEVTAGGAPLYLSQLATVVGSPEEVKLLKQIPILNHLPLCSERTISKREIASKIALYLERNGLTVGDIEVKGPNRVVVKTPCSKVGGDSLSELIRSYIKENYPDFTVLYVPRITVQVPYSHYDQELRLVSIGNGYARFIYQVLVNGKVVKKVWIPVRIDRLERVVVAAVLIPKGTKITPTMVKLASVPSRKAYNAFHSVKEVVGSIARTDILSGKIIRPTMLKPNFLVKRNMPVKVVYNSGPIHIELLGVALDNGVKGHIIRVKNISTGKVLRCRVVGEGLVEFLSE